MMADDKPAHASNMGKKKMRIDESARVVHVDVPLPCGATEDAA